MGWDLASYFVSEIPYHVRYNSRYQQGGKFEVHLSPKQVFLLTSCFTFRPKPVGFRVRVEGLPNLEAVWNSAWFGCFVCPEMSYDA